MSDRNVRSTRPVKRLQPVALGLNQSLRVERRAERLANRPKRHWHGRTARSRSKAIDASACNEARLLISILAYQLMHIARRAMARATGGGWSLRHPRERVRRAGSRLVLSSRRMTLALSRKAAPFWSLLWPRIARMHWAGPWARPPEHQ